MLEDQVEDTAERDRVNAWRITMFLDLGFTVDQAIALAHTDVDHHQARALLDRGCTPDVAIAILA